MSHTIRLHGFWDTIPEGQGYRHSRPFGRPRTLDAGERVWLVCPALSGTVEARLNGASVGRTEGPGVFAVDITDSLQPRNRVEFVTSTVEPPGDIALEIRGGSS
jgi:hypothetical protein